MRKIEEIRELSDKDLKERLTAEQTQLLQMKIDHSITPVDDSSSITKKRRDIARIKTEIRAREIKKEKEAAKAQQQD